MDVSTLVELKPEGKVCSLSWPLIVLTVLADQEESVITAEMMDLRIADICSTGDYVLLLQSPSHSLVSPGFWFCTITKGVRHSCQHPDLRWGAG